MNRSNSTLPNTARGLHIVVALSMLSCKLAAQEITPLPQPQLIDFEWMPDGSPPVEGMEISTQFAASFGVSFGQENGKYPRIAKRDSGDFLAFYGPGKNHPAPNQGVGDFFLTNHGGYTADVSPLIITYSQPVAQASGVIIDIDQADRWVIEARNAEGAVLEAMTLSTDSPNAGNGRAAPWAFTRANAEIASIRIAYTGESSPIGWALDNLAPRSARMPAALTCLKSQNGLQIAICGEYGGSYLIEYTESLSSANWQVLTSVILNSAPEQLVFDPAGSTAPSRFYRVH